MHRCRAGTVVVAVGLALAAVGCGSDNGPSASFTSPDQGTSLAGGVPIAMSASGVRIEEAGEVHDGAGHFHVIADAGCTPKGEVITKDADHLHFGKGQTEGVIYLEPGKHQLCLEVGDGVHEALGVADTRTIDVAVTDQDEWCRVIGEVDALYREADSVEGDFAAYQAGFENVRRLLAQLEDGLAVIDQEQAEYVGAFLAENVKLVTAAIDASDPQDLEKRLLGVFGQKGLSTDTPGVAWIETECGIDVGT